MNLAYFHPDSIWQVLVMLLIYYGVPVLLVILAFIAMWMIFTGSRK